MRKLILLCLLFCSLAGYTQTDTNKSLHPGKRPALIHSDSILTRLQEQRDSALKEIQIQQDQESIQRNLDSFVRMNKEREAKQKRAALLRIGFGIALLIVLVIGLRRKRKK